MHKKVLNWKDKFTMLGMYGYIGSTYLTLHANNIQELDQKKAEIKKEFETKYTDREIEVRGTY